MPDCGKEQGAPVREPNTGRIGTAMRRAVKRTDFGVFRERGLISV